MPTTLEAASGRWPELLCALGGVSAEQLTDEHQPCPACGGTDRFRWDDDDGPGGWFCNQCGGKDRQGGGGTGVDLLMRLRGWDLTQALRHVDGYLGGDRTAAPAIATPPVRPRKPKRPARIPDVPPAGTPPPELGRAVAQWPYGPDPENPWFWIQRIPMEPEESGGKPEKRFVHRTWLDGRWHWPRSRGPQADPFTSEWPAPRPLYGLPDLLARPEAPVLVVEGEKAADAAARLAPGHAIVSGCGGTGGINAVDWTPLAGRTVMLWPDNDDAGRKFMAKLGLRLQQLGATVSVIIPPASLGLPPGWDAADAAQQWGPREFDALVRQHSRPLDPLPEPEQEPAPEPPAEPPTQANIPDPADFPFTCLGFEGDAYYYQPHDTGQVLRFTGKGHTSTALLQLAGETWWESVLPAKTGVNWQAAFSMLFRRQAAVGVFDPSRVRGRGAWLDDGRCVLHLGDRLIIDGESFDVRRPPPTRFNYQRAASMDIDTALEPLTDQEGAQLIHIADQFHWETPASGLLIAGWIALAPICGALSWRPHVWLTAGAGSGKSTLLDRFLGPLLAELAIYPEGNATEAGVRQTLRADARPVVFDEAESNEKADQQRIQSVLSLARVASSSGRGVIIKGGASGEAQQFRIRSMFMLCSISTALKHGADQSRFAQLTMRSPNHLPRAQRQAHWQTLSADLDLITPELGQRLLLRSVRSIGVIRESVAAFRRAAGERLDSQRQGDQYGTLLAGAWSLMNQRPATHADALALIDANDWRAYLDSSEPDENRCLQQLLQHQVRVETERLQLTGAQVISNAKVITRTVWELIEAVRTDAEAGDVPADVAEAHLGRIGLRVQDDRLLVSNTALGLQRILAETPWAHSWPTVLGRIPGAEKPGKVRFKGMSGNSRAVSLPLVGVEG